MLTDDDRPRIEIVQEDGPFCGWGWKSRRPCNYTGGCCCFLALGHQGRCHCEMCGTRVQRPKDWDATGRAEANA